jgi:structural maintenance of chromosome 4
MRAFFVCVPSLYINNHQEGVPIREKRRIAPLIQNLELVSTPSKKEKKGNPNRVQRTHNKPEKRGMSVTTRLVIRDIIVENFKSYAGVHLIGPFHSTFTAVIGPNGSGKSNVIDSLLFVFGKNAKKIRLDKLSSLIHNSAAFPNLSYASVTVNFVEISETPEGAKDPDYRVEVPKSDFSVKRDVSKTNNSNYYINGQKATQKEVVTLLTSKGVDLDHNRFLILQGEVEQIALMKPKAEKEGEEGLLEYFDDLIGTTRFIASIQEAQTRTTALQEERLSLLDRKNKAEAERDMLAKGKQSTVEFVRKDNALQDTIITLAQLKSEELKEQLQQPLSEIRAIEEELGGIATASKNLKAQAEALKGQEQEQKRMLDLVAKEIKTIEGRKQAVEESRERAKADADEHDKQLKKETDKLKKAREDVRDNETKYQDAERSAEVAQTHVTDLTERIQQLQPRVDAKTEELRGAKEPLLRELETKRKALAPYENKVVVAEQTRESAVKRLERFDDAVSKRTLEQQKHEAELAQKTNRLRDLDEMLQAAESAQQGGAQRQASLENRLEQLTRAKYSVNSEIEAIKKEFRDSQADDKVVEFLKKQQSLTGQYFGTLRQLGSIDDIYDIAAGVASIMWGFHVVTTAETGTKVLHLLKENDMGRATVIVLDEVRSTFGDAIDRKFHAPEGTQRLYDLIHVKNPLHLPAFYSAVRDTLVCDNLSTARKVGLGGAVRHRVVTLRGELVEPLGAMTGGGSSLVGAKLKAAAQSTMDRTEARQLLPALQAKLDAAVRDERQLMEDLHEEREKAKSFTPEHIRKLRQEKVMVQNVVEGLKTRLGDLQQQQRQASGDSSQRSDLQKELRAAEDALEKAKKEQLSFKIAVETLEEQIEGIGGAEFRSMQQEVAALKKQLAEQEKACADHRRNGSKFRAAKERRETEITEIEKKIQHLQTDASQCAKEELAQLAMQIETLAKEVRQQNAAASKIEGDMAGIKKSLEGIDHQLKAAETRKRERELELASKRTAIAQKQEELDKYDRRIEQCDVKVRENLRDFGLETLHSDVMKFLEVVGVLKCGVPGGDDEAEADFCVEENRASLRKKKHQKKGAKRRRSSSAEGESDSEVDPRRRTWNDLRRIREGEMTDDDINNLELTDEMLAKFSMRKPSAELQHYIFEDLKMLAKEFNSEVARLRDTIDFDAVKNWKIKNDESKKAKAQYEQVVAEFNQMERQLEVLKEERRVAFMATFSVIQGKLRELYQLLAAGGDAELQLVETEDPFEGINFVVRPPRKSWKQVGSLSGGEKTLSSLALVFALHHVKPTPIYVLDEIDAALDYANVSIVARYVLQHSIGAQFIIISLRNNMFELAHQLVGICKVKDVTRSLALNPRSLRLLVESKLLNGSTATVAGEAQSKRPTKLESGAH